MNQSRTVAALVVSLGMLGCSTPQPPVGAALVAAPPPEIQRDLPLEQPAAGMPRTCKLGESCLTMDERPFEACLVDTKHCVDKAVETMPARGPRDEAEPRAIQARE